MKKHQFFQYEISAYARDNQYCQHNMNYWLFGDYVGIGAGAHAKLTDFSKQKIFRKESIKNPKQYLSATQFGVFQEISNSELPLEFMMNALRLDREISIELFESRTGLSFSCIEKPIKQAINLNLITQKNHVIQLTEQGKLFLNDILMLF